jgi:hypothetical protein
MKTLLSRYSNNQPNDAEMVLHLTPLTILHGSVAVTEDVASVYNKQQCTHHIIP